MLSKVFFLFRIIAYTFISTTLYFYYTSQNTKKNSEQQTKANQIIQNENKNNIKILSCVGECLYSNNEDKLWHLFEEGKSFENNYSFAVNGENSKMLIDVNEDISIYIFSNAKISLNRDNNKLSLKVINNCVTFNTNKTKSTLFLDNINKDIQISGLNYYCDKDIDIRVNNIPETVNNSSDLTGKFYNIEEDFYKLFSPCDDIIVLESGSDTKNISFSFLAPVLGSKVFQVSNDSNFSSLNSSFNIKNYFNYSVLLAKGNYFWRLKSTSGEIKSDKCKFSLTSEKEISLIEPSNFDVFSSGPLNFAWSDFENVNMYKLLLSKDSDFSSIAYSKSQKELKNTIDDPVQTLGSGAYYWKIETDKGIDSLVKKFYIYTDGDVLIYEPSDKKQFKSNTNFVKVVWNNFYNVKTYTFDVSRSPSFTNIDYSTKTSVPFVYVPNIGDGEYYYKINVLFNNNAKISSKHSSFIISNNEFINVIEPVQLKQYFLNKEELELVWACAGKEQKFVASINNEQKLISDYNFDANYCSYVLKYPFKELNELVIKEQCETQVCNKSKTISFYTKKNNAPKIIFNNFIELNNKGLAYITWTKTSKPIEYELFDKDKKIISSGSTERKFLLFRLSPATYFIKLKEAGKNLSDFQKFKVIDAKPGMPVLKGPNHRKVAKPNELVSFFWNKAKRAKAYELRIYNSNSKDPEIIKTDKLKLKKKFKKGTYYWSLYAYDYVDDSIRYSNGTKKRMLIVK